MDFFKHEKDALKGLIDRAEGLFDQLKKKLSKDKCFPYGQKEVNGLKPESFPDHDLRPVREGHISRLGAYFDWVKECSRCGYEDFDLKEYLKFSETAAYEAEMTRRADQVDALVQTLPFREGTLSIQETIQEGPQDNCCATSTHKDKHGEGWHSILDLEKTIVEYSTNRLSDSSHYAYRINLLNKSDGSGKVYVWECTYCKQLVKWFLASAPARGDGE